MDKGGMTKHLMDKGNGHEQNDSFISLASLSIYMLSRFPPVYLRCLFPLSTFCCCGHLSIFVQPVIAPLIRG